MGDRSARSTFKYSVSNAPEVSVERGCSKRPSRPRVYYKARPTLTKAPRRKSFGGKDGANSPSSRTIWALPNTVYVSADTVLKPIDRSPCGWDLGAEPKAVRACAPRWSVRVPSSRVSPGVAQLKYGSRPRIPREQRQGWQLVPQRIALRSDRSPRIQANFQGHASAAAC